MKISRNQPIAIGKELLADLVDRVSAQDLREISEMDCRSEKDYVEDAPKHYAPLLRIKETQDTYGLGHWYPLEVIEMYSWTRLVMEDLRRHTMRAFCCTVILHTHCDYSAPVTSCDTTLGNLVESLLCIDHRLLQKADTLFDAMLDSHLIDEEDKVLVPVAQLVSILPLEDEKTLRFKLDDILQAEDRLISTRFLAFEENNDFFAKRDKPQSEYGWRFASNYIYQYLSKVRDEKLRVDLLSLCIRLWNPNPTEFVPYPSVIYL